MSFSAHKRTELYTWWSWHNLNRINHLQAVWDRIIVFVFSRDPPWNTSRTFAWRATKYTLPYFVVQRAKTILMAAEGMANDEIAAALDTRREVVSLWRKHFFEERLPGLEERP